MKILVIGGNGQLGFELQRSLSLFGDVSITTRNSKCPAGHACLRLDIEDTEELNSVLENLRPHVVVNAAAYTQVDLAQTHWQKAEAINARAVANMARKAREISALLIHFSSDYVYSGENRIPWTERDPTIPLSKYGMSKLAGDEAILQSDCAHWILRTQWLYAPRGQNFMRTMLRIAEERIRSGSKEPLRIVDDQLGAPTPVRWVAGAVAAMISRWLQDLSMPGQSRTGIYHLSSAGETTWYGFAEEIFEQAYMLGLLSEIPKITPITSAEFAAPAMRPRYSVLSNQKIAREFDLRLCDWREGLAQTMAEYKLFRPPGSGL